MFKKFNFEKKQAYTVLTAIGLFLIFTFQNFNSFETSEKSSTDLSSALNSTENEIKKIKKNIDQELKIKPQTQSRHLARTGKVILSKESIRIKLKRAPAKVPLKKKKPKTKLKPKKSLKKKPLKHND